MTGIIQGLLASLNPGYVPPMAYGTAYQGGYFAGQISTSGDGIATHNIVIAPKSSGQSNKLWKVNITDTPNTASVINGPTNSSNMNNADHPAAQFCEGLSIGGYSDWYLPALKELAVCYIGLKPTTANNNTSSGINDYSVPKRTSNYTTTDPGRTSATDFQDSNSEAFGASAYWSSTSDGTSNAFIITFSSGEEFSLQKNASNYLTRAIRRVAV